MEKIILAIGIIMFAASAIYAIVNVTNMCCMFFGCDDDNADE